MKYIARFTPQAWIRDWAVEVDSEGPREWDVTDLLLAMSEQERTASMVPDSYESDELRHADNAPHWVSDWHGPFYIEVRETET